MTLTRRLLLPLATLLLTGVVGCGTTSPGPAASKPSANTLPKVEGTLTGTLKDVTTIEPSADAGPKPLGTVLVDPPGKSAAAMPMVFEITAATVLFRQYAGQGDGELTAIEFSTLTSGMTARVGYSGPVRESFPAQATADYLVLEDPEA